MKRVTKPRRPATSPRRNKAAAVLSVTLKSDVTAANFSRVMKPMHYDLRVLKTAGFADLANHRLVRRMLVDALTRSNRVVDWGLELPWENRSLWSVGRLREGCKAYVAGLDNALATLSEVQSLSATDYAATYPELAAEFAVPSRLLRYAAAKVKALESGAKRLRGHSLELSVDLEFAEESQSVVALLDVRTAVLRILHLGSRA